MSLQIFLSPQTLKMGLEKNLLVTFIISLGFISSILERQSKSKLGFKLYPIN